MNKLLGLIAAITLISQSHAEERNFVLFVEPSATREQIEDEICKAVKFGAKRINVVTDGYKKVCIYENGLVQWSAYSRWRLVVVSELNCK
jgi:ribosomal protein L23